MACRRRRPRRCRPPRQRLSACALASNANIISVFFFVTCPASVDIVRLKSCNFCFCLHFELCYCVLSLVVQYIFFYRFHIYSSQQKEPCVRFSPLFFSLSLPHQPPPLPLSPRGRVEKFSDDYVFDANGTIKMFSMNQEYELYSNRKMG